MPIQIFISISSAFIIDTLQQHYNTLYCFWGYVEAIIITLYSSRSELLNTIFYIFSIIMNCYGKVYL